MSNSIENDCVVDAIDVPSTSVVLKENINLDVPVDKNKQNWIDNRGNYLLNKFKMFSK